MFPTQRISIVSLVVADLDRSRAFYEEGLGFAPLQAMDGIVYYQMPGFILSLLTREVWAKEQVDGAAPGPATLAINMTDRQSVDAHLARADGAGGRLLKKAHETYWGGYSGYFADPDGHYWEVAYAPSMTFDETGAVTSF